MCRALHAPVWLLTVDRIQCSEVFASYSLFIDRHQQLSPFFNPIYLHLHAVHLTKKPPLCFYSIDYMLPVDFRHKSHFFVNKVSRRDGAGFEWRGCVNSRLMTRLAGYYAQLSLMMIGIDAISHGFLRTSFRNRGRACSVFGKYVSSVNNNSNFQPLHSSVLTPFQSGPDQINDILTDIFETSQLRQFDLLK